MTNTTNCQLCREPNTNTYVYNPAIAAGTTIMCVDRAPCAVREEARRIDDEIRWAAEDEAQWVQEEAEQAAEDAWEDAQTEAYSRAVSTLY